MMAEQIFVREFETDLLGKTVKVYSSIGTLPFANNEKFIDYIFQIIKKLNQDVIFNEDNDISLSITAIHTKLPDNFLITYNMNKKLNGAKQFFVNPIKHTYTLLCGKFNYSS